MGAHNAGTVLWMLLAGLFQELCEELSTKGQEQMKVCLSSWDVPMGKTIGPEMASAFKHTTDTRDLL